MAEHSDPERVYSSDFAIDMAAEFVFENYPSLKKENNPDGGVENASQIVFHPVDLDELLYVFMTEGTHMILFGGVWSEATQKLIAPINELAHRHQVDTIYLYDFSADGTAYADIKRDLTEQPDYDGPGKSTPNDFAVYNYYYGEMAKRCLPNLKDWVRDNEQAGRKGDITYLDQEGDPVSVPNLTEPFLFLYNKDNTVDHSGKADEESACPILWAAELTGRESKEELEEKIFRHVGEEGAVLTPYHFDDYMRDAFGLNERGHSFKTQPAFEEGDPIQVQKVNFQVFHWMLQQKGSFVFMIAGPWCAYSQGGVATVNDYAVANGLRAYMTDIRLDSKHAIDFWHFPRQNELTLSCPPMRRYYIEIWEKYFPRAEVMCSIDPDRYWKQSVTVDWTDEEGREHSVLGVGVPYILSYNKDHVDSKGRRAPILASRHDSGELINCSDEYVYYKPNYVAYRAAIYRVYYWYMVSVGKEEEMKDITVDRTAPKVEGSPVPHPEYAKVYRQHDWYKERADRN